MKAKHAALIREGIRVARCFSNASTALLLDDPLALRAWQREYPKAEARRVERELEDLDWIVEGYNAMLAESRARRRKESARAFRKQVIWRQGR